VNALRKIHRALVPGGLVIDTQPVSAHPPVESGSGMLGTLDMSEWARTIATIDGLVQQTIDRGLFDLERESRYVVTDEYDDGAEFVTVTREWAGTMVHDAVAGLVGAQSQPVRLHQEIRLRLLLARTAPA
jgi:hypothetical protein